MIKIKTRVYFNHGIPYLGYKGILRYILFLVEIFNLYLTDKCLTVSKDMKYYLRKIKNNVDIIWNGSACGIDLNFFNAKKKIKTKKIIVTYIGRLKKRKGSLILVDLVNYFKNRNDIEFIFSGFSHDEFYKISKKKI